jgi:serine/threonine-protein kinase
MTQSIGRYRIDGVLGTGAMGVVYKAFDTRIARAVALKTIRRECLDGEQAAELVARFRHEAQASGRLVHPNIVAIFDSGDDGDTAYIAMEYVDGAPLTAFLARDVPMDLNAAMACMAQLLRALDYAHGRGVVHRDIKPANILVGAGARVKITDFGIARLDASTLTQVGAVVGTPSYMAPEQFHGLAVDGRADIFSAGVVLYQMLTGARPFSGTASEVIYQVLHDTPPAPGSRRDGLHPAFDAVMERALAKDAAGRFPTAQAFADALADAHLQHNGGLQSAAGTGGLLMSPEALDGVRQRLATYIGPIASVLVKRAAKVAADPAGFHRLLAEHVPDAAERARFLKEVGEA